MHTTLLTDDVEALIVELKRTRDEGLRDRIIELHGPLVRALARRFQSTHAAREDLEQTAWLALIRALGRYDPGQGNRFSTYATACIMGEIKHDYRDRAWALKMPRFFQEIVASLRPAQERLRRRLGREPTVPEMALALQVSEERLAEAMELRSQVQVTSLDEPAPEQGDAYQHTLGDRLGGEDLALQRAIEMAPVRAALGSLEPRARRILERRYYEGYSQTEVAAELGVSQMQVSRLERAALEHVRERLSHDEAAATPAAA